MIFSGYEKLDFEIQCSNTKKQNLIFDQKYLNVRICKNVSNFAWKNYHLLYAFDDKFGTS